MTGKQKRLKAQKDLKRAKRYEKRKNIRCGDDNAIRAMMDERFNSYVAAVEDPLSAALRVYFDVMFEIECRELGELTQEAIDKAVKDVLGTASD